MKQHPLATLYSNRQSVIENVVFNTTKLYSNLDIEGLEEKITDTIFWERKRLERSTDTIRDTLDQLFLNDITTQYKQLLSSKNENAGYSQIQAEWKAAYKESLYRILTKIVTHHAEEIAGNFNPRVYKLATVAVPLGFGWLLRALSTRSIFKNLQKDFRGILGEKLDLRRKIHLEGKIKEIQHLSKKGTVILVPTHFSNLDSILVGWALFAVGLPPFCYGAGLNLFSNPVLGYFMNNLGAYKVDRAKQHGVYKDTIKAYSKHILEKGCHSLFFPGGGRSRSGALEKKLKLGLLSTSIEAYVENLLAEKKHPNIYIVPCTISYHFVLEAASLIDDFISEKAPLDYMLHNDESFNPKEMANFLYKFFKASSTIYMNFGSAMDPFGNLVDEDGVSMTAHGRKIDTTSFVRSHKGNGEICHNAQRDSEYTKILGRKILERFRVENIALTSHFIAYCYFEFLRDKFGHKDLFRIFKLTKEETATPYSVFAQYAQPMLDKLHSLYESGQILLEPALRSNELKNIIESASRNMGIFHIQSPFIISKEQAEDVLYSENTKLLFYYHNRMEGYKLSLREQGLR